MTAFSRTNDDQKRYRYGESNYSPIVVHKKTGDYKRGTTVATPISPDWGRGETKFTNKETYVDSRKLNALDYIKKIANYYQGEWGKDWGDLQKALDHLVNKDVYGDEAAERVADALQSGENPLKALESFRKEKLESLEQPIT